MTIIHTKILIKFRFTLIASFPNNPPRYERGKSESGRAEGCGVVLGVFFYGLVVFDCEAADFYDRELYSTKIFDGYWERLPEAVHLFSDDVDRLFDGTGTRCFLFDSATWGVRSWRISKRGFSRSA